METTEYFDQFTELYCDGITEECIIASLIDSGHQDALEFLPDEKDYVQRLITEGATYDDMIFKHWWEMHEEIWDNISHCIGNKALLKRNVCSLILPFREVSQYFFPGKDASDVAKIGAQYLKDLCYHNLPQVSEMNSMGQSVVAELKKRNGFSNLSSEEQRQLFEKEMGAAIDKYNERLKANIYKITRLVHGMMEELAVHITICLLEQGETTTIFDYQRMCGIVLTDVIHPFYFCRTMDWPIEFAESYLPKSIYYYENPLEQTEGQDIEQKLTAIPESIKRAVEDGKVGENLCLKCSNTDFVKYCVEKGFFEPYQIAQWRQIDCCLKNTKGKTIEAKHLAQCYQDLQSKGKV